MKRVHHGGRAYHREQARDDEQLALAEAPDKPEQRIEHQPPDEHEADDRGQREKGQRPAGRLARVGRDSRQRGNDRDQGHDREILEQQDRERPFALRCVELVVRPQHRQDLRGRGQAQRQADGDRGRERNAEREMEQQADRQAAQHDLCEAQPENVPAQPPQPARLQLQPDDEQQQRDPDLGDPGKLVGVADEPEQMRADQRSGDDIAQRCPELQAAEQGDEDQRGAEHDRTRLEDRPGRLRRLRGAVHCADSIAASKARNGNRIAPCRDLRDRAGASAMRPGHSPASARSPASQALSSTTA